MHPGKVTVPATPGFDDILSVTTPVDRSINFDWRMSPLQIDTG
jgi:hypothetical protein